MPRRCNVRRLALGEAGLCQQQIGAHGEACERVERTSVRRIDERFSPCSKANRVRLDRVRGADELDVEWPDRTVERVLECVDVIELRRRDTERSCNAAAFGDRRHDREHPHLGVARMPSHVRQRNEIEPVIAVQMAQVDRVDVIRVDEPLQGTQRSVAEVEQQPEAIVLDEVTRAGGFGTRMAARAADNG